MKAFGIKDGHLVLEPMPGFHSDANTLGRYSNNEVINDYKKAQNKMILTGRGEKLRAQIEQRLDDLGIERPNYGLYLFPGGDKGVKLFKMDVILNSIRENNWETVHFYEDRLDWLKTAQDAVEQVYPNVTFIPHHITNIKDSHSL